MHCFVCNEKAGLTHSRFMSCSGDECKTLDIDTMLQRTNSSTVGPLIRHNLDEQPDVKPPSKRRETP